MWFLRRNDCFKRCWSGHGTEGGGCCSQGSIKNRDHNLEEMLRSVRWRLHWPSQSRYLLNVNVNTSPCATDSLKGMKSAWRADVDRQPTSLYEDMRKREERWRSEAETTGKKKYAKFLEESKARKSDLQSMEQLREEDARIRYEVEEELREEMRALKERVLQSSLAASAEANCRVCVHTSVSPTTPCAHFYPALR
jgi:hypothetical protein